jgi:aryl carrier-like protein
MILELLKYFAKYPTKAGVLNLFKRGESSIAGYAELLSFAQALPATSVMPGIENYVVASDIDSTKQLVAGFVGVPTYLMLDYGEIVSTPNQRNTLLDNMRLAITVAMRLQDTADLIEQGLASAQTLTLINELRAHLMADSRNSVLGTFVSEFISGQHTIVPFEWKDTSSIGWTLAFTMDATDMLDVSTLRRSLQP